MSCPAALRQGAPAIEHVKIIDLQGPWHLIADNGTETIKV